MKPIQSKLFLFTILTIFFVCQTRAMSTSACDMLMSDSGTVVNNVNGTSVNDSHHDHHAMQSQMKSSLDMNCCDSGVDCSVGECVSVGTAIVTDLFFNTTRTVTHAPSIFSFSSYKQIISRLLRPPILA